MFPDCVAITLVELLCDVWEKAADILLILTLLNSELIILFDIIHVQLIEPNSVGSLLL